MAYIIESSHQWTDKKGVSHKMTSYFQNHALGIMNCMTTKKEEAKQWDTKGGATNAIAKFRLGKGAKAIKYSPEQVAAND